MTFTTKIGKFNVHVRKAHSPSLVWFDAGVHGKQFGERGIFSFWTAVLKNAPKNKRKVWGRSLSVIPCGDRFDRMQYEQKTAKTKDDREHYAKWWKSGLKKGANVSYIRPSTMKEIHQWVSTHYPDAKFIKWLIVDGRYYGGRFELVQRPAIEWKAK